MGFDFKSPFGEDIGILGHGELDVLGARSLDFDFLSAREEFIQRVIRRLCTGKGEWIIFPDYGAGIRALVNEPASFELISKLKAEIRNQLLREADVEATPGPDIQIDILGSSLFVQIKVLTKSVGLVAFSFDPRVV